MEQSGTPHTEPHPLHPFLPDLCSSFFMLLLVQSSRRITRVEELGSFKAEGVTTQVIGFILRLHLGVKTIQKAHRPIFTKRLCNSLKSGVRPAINRNVRVGPVHQAPMQGDDYKRAGEIVLDRRAGERSGESA